MYRRIPSVLSCALCIALFAAVPMAEAAEVVRYDGNRIIELDITTEAQLKALQDLHIDFWTHHVGVGVMEARVTPEQLAEINKLNIPYVVEIADLQMWMDANALAFRGTSFFDSYHTYEENLEYMDDAIGGDGLLQLYPTLTQSVDFGTSLEGRDMTGIRITGAGAGDKPEVLFHGGQHAREWITVPVQQYLATYLLENYGTDPLVTKLVDRLEWYILPIMNPDGYVYTWTTERFWRKNRRDNGNGTFGVDLNRNWGFQWNMGGSSPFGGDETYHGTGPFSEPETQNMRDFVMAHPDIVTHIDFHSFSQLHLWPWGYTNTLPPDQDEFDYLGQGYVDVIESVHGEVYIPGPIMPTLYQASGSSVDWMYGDQGILSFTTELRPESGDVGGFDLPADQIIPTCEEITPAVLWYVDQVTTPLRISLVDPLPELTTPDLDFTLSVLITENADTLQGGSPTLHYREGNAGPFTTAALTHISGDTYEATLPGRDCGDDTEFYVSAMGTLGETVTLPTVTTQDVLSIGIGEKIGFVDNFESDTGWSTEVLGASSGQWERGVPVNDSGWDYDPSSDSDGSGQAYLTQNQNGNTDVDDGAVRLISPTVDLSDPTSSIRFDYFLRLTVDDGDDALVVEVDENDGAGPWIEVWRDDTDNGLSWTTQVITQTDLANASVTPNATMRVRFTANDDGTPSITEAGVDAFEAASVTCTPVNTTCGDFDNDGDVDLSDFSQFSLCFGGANLPPAASCPPGVDADCDDDGDVDLGDFSAFSLNFTGPL